MLQTQKNTPKSDVDKAPNNHSSSIHKPPKSPQPDSGKHNDLQSLHHNYLCDTGCVSEKMSSTTPVKVGTRGTVGALVLQEIEYFSKLDSPCKNSQGSQPQTNSCSGSCKAKFGSGSMTQKRKKKKDGGRFIPSICSVVEVVETNRLNRIHGVSYRNLRTDSKKLQG